MDRWDGGIQVIGRGEYGVVHRERVHGVSCAVKRIDTVRDYGKAEFLLELSVFNVSEQVREFCGLRLFPRLVAEGYSDAMGSCAFAMEEYTWTLDKWLTMRNKPAAKSRDLAYLMFHVLIRLHLLHSMGIFHNDSFFRNAMVREADPSRRVVTEYIVSFDGKANTHFLVRNLGVDVVLIDGGLASGDVLGLSHSKRVKSMQCNEGKHPLQRSWAVRRPDLIDHASVCMSIGVMLKHVDSVGLWSSEYGAMKLFLDHYMGLVEEGCDDADIFRGALTHPFILAIMENGIPSKVCNMAGIGIKIPRLGVVKSQEEMRADAKRLMCGEMSGCDTGVGMDVVDMKDGDADGMRSPKRARYG